MRNASAAGANDGFANALFLVLLTLTGVLLMCSR